MTLEQIEEVLTGLRSRMIAARNRLSVEVSNGVKSAANADGWLDQSSDGSFVYTISASALEEPRD